MLLRLWSSTDDTDVVIDVSLLSSPELEMNVVPEVSESDREYEYAMGAADDATAELMKGSQLSWLFRYRERFAGAPLDVTRGSKARGLQAANASEVETQEW